MYMGFPTRHPVDVRAVQALWGPDRRMGCLRLCQERVIQTLTRFTRRWGALTGVPRGGRFHRYGGVPTLHAVDVRAVQAP